MGLAGRKVKQRIGADPRNLSWADNAARFGQSYLAKFGWDSTQKLGISGEGLSSHLKVAQKLDMLGIGAGAQQQDGVAWKQSRDYEILLKKLNANAADATPSVEMGVGDEIQTEDAAGDQTKDVKDTEASVDEEKKEKKRKKKDEDGGKKKKRKKSKDSDETETKASKEAASVESKPQEVARPLPRPMAHRARFLASKRLSALSSSAMSEILGISPSTSTAASSSTTPLPGTPQPDRSESQTPQPDSASDELGLHKLTTSTHSMADYFKQRLALKSGNSSVAATPTPGTPKESSEEQDEEDVPQRIGLGARRAVAQANDDGSDGGERRIGLGGSRLSMFASAFVSSSNPSASTTLTPASTSDSTQAQNDTSEKKKEKKKAKQEASEDTGPLPPSPSVEPSELTKKKKKKSSSVDQDEALTAVVPEKAPKKEKKSKKQKTDSEKTPTEEREERKKEKKKKKEKGGAES